MQRDRHLACLNQDSPNRLQPQNLHGQTRVIPSPAKRRALLRQNMKIRIPEANAVDQPQEPSVAGEHWPHRRRQISRGRSSEGVGHEIGHAVAIRIRPGGRRAECICVAGQVNDCDRHLAHQTCLGPVGHRDAEIVGGDGAVIEGTADREHSVAIDGKGSAVISRDEGPTGKRIVFKVVGQNGADDRPCGRALRHGETLTRHERGRRVAAIDGHGAGRGGEGEELSGREARAGDSRISGQRTGQELERRALGGRRGEAHGDKVGSNHRGIARPRHDQRTAGHGGCSGIRIGRRQEDRAGTCLGQRALPQHDGVPDFHDAID